MGRLDRTAGLWQQNRVPVRSPRNVFLHDGLRRIFLTPNGRRAYGRVVSAAIIEDGLVPCAMSRELSFGLGHSLKSTFMNSFRCWSGFPVMVAIAVALPATSSAQAPRFGEVRVPAAASGEELASQPELWVMDVNFKPMRQIIVELTDPQTGQKKPQYVWYIAYRAVNRKLANRAVAEAPVNELDPPVIPPQFIPVFTLQTTDTDVPKLYQDQILPEALAAINLREKSKLKSSVSAVMDVPPATEPGAADQQVIEGVATWTGIDGEADRYTVYLTGFSNGFRKVAGPDGAEVVQWKTIRLKYWRPGDNLNQREPEIRLETDAANQPMWIYR